MYVRDLVVHRSWLPSDVLTADAYDASGIANIRWSYEVNGTVKTSGIMPVGPIYPARLVKPGSPPGWLHLSMEDKKKNSSYAIRIPVK